MELNVRDDFSKLLDVGRFEIDSVKCKDVVLEVPKIDAKLVGRQEVLAIWTSTERIDVVIVAVLELLAFHPFVALTHNGGFWEDQLVVDNLSLGCLLVLLVLHFPQFDYAVIRGKQLHTAIFMMV